MPSDIIASNLINRAEPAPRQADLAHSTTQPGDAVVTGLDHYTLRCREDEIAPLTEFYGRALGLHPGKRPDFDFPGVWLCMNGIPIVHVAARLPPGAPDANPGNTGRLDHISFFSNNRAAVEARLNAAGIPFHGTPVPGFPLYQLFFHDPVGVKVEVTFRTA